MCPSDAKSKQVSQAGHMIFPSTGDKVCLVGIILAEAGVTRALERKSGEEIGGFYKVVIKTRKEVTG